MNRSRVQRLRTRPAEVTALYHDGSRQAAAEILRWVRTRASRDPQVAAELRWDGTVVVTESGQGDRRSVTVGAGQYAAQDPFDPYGWGMHTPQTLRRRFELLPREMPVFDDGEVA